MQPEKQSTPFWQKLALIAVGIGMAVVLVVVVLTLFPGLVRDPRSKARTQANQTLEIEFYYTDGDLFAWLPGKVRPPDENVLEAKYTISWDANGFRVPALVADHYPIVVFGDSFTEGPNVAMPYPDKIAEILGVPVQNLGYRAYGPLENAQVAQEFMGDEPRSWVLYGHFAGNDMGQAEVDPEKTIQERTPLQFIPFLAGRALEQAGVAAPPDPNVHYDYPMPVIIGGNYYDMAILFFYTWWQIAPPEGFEATRAYQVIGETLDTINQQVDDRTCRALIFIPPKGALYFPYLVSKQPVLDNVQHPIINANGVMELVSAPETSDQWDALMASLENQRDAMRHRAEESGWYFIDLLAPMQATVAQGELLYYRYDTHWNQAGHDLAAQVISDFMRQHEAECPLER